MKKGFALIYVLVIMTIVLISMTQILSLGLADSRQKNKVLATAGAYQMAQSGIEDGIANFNIGKPKDCVPKYYKLSSNTRPSGASHDSMATDQGDYQFNICPNYVTATGYFKGSKVAMRADLKDPAKPNQWNIYQVGF